MPSSPSHRLSPRPLAAFLGAMLLAGCVTEDPRVAGLAAGISKDSALAVMGGAPVELPESYLKQGHFIEAYLFRREGALGTAASLTREDLTPVVLIDGTLSGWGWDHWDSVASANQISVSHAK